MLLFRFLRLWYCLLFQTATLSPRRMYIYTKNVYKDTHYGRPVSQCFGTYEFTRFQEAKTKRKDAFCQYVCATLCALKSVKLGRYILPLFNAVGGSGRVIKTFAAAKVQQKNDICK